MTFDLLAAIDAANEDDVINIPHGAHAINEPIVLRKRVTLRGDTVASGENAVKLHCPGIVNWAPGARFEGFMLDGHGHTGTDGILARRTCEIRDVSVFNYEGDGIRVDADVNREGEYQNANRTVIERVYARNCERGLYMDGGDVNACSVYMFNAIHNRSWGIYDSGFLGSTYVACHTAANGGGYKTDNPNARHVLLGCYAERNQWPNELSRNTIYNGLMGPTTGGISISDGQITPFKVDSGNGVQTSYGTLPNRALSVLAEGDHPHGLAIGYYDDRNGTIQIRHASLNARVSMAFTTNNTIWEDESGQPIPPGELVLPKSYWVPAGGGKYRKVDHST